MKKKLNVFIFLMTIFFCAALFGCAAVEEKGYDTYTVNFVLIKESSEFNRNSSAETGQVTCPDEQERQGFEFNGWHTDPEKNSPFSFETVLTSDITLYAHWTRNTNRLIFDGNNSSTGSMDDVYVSSFLTTLLPLSNYTRVGYTFGGWSDSASGTIKHLDGGWYYMEGESVYFLYAVWLPISYDVVFNTMGGSGGSQNASIKFGSQLSGISLPTKEGYVFEGYYSTTDFSKNNYYSSNITDTAVWDIAEDTTLYAKWVPKENIIQFDGNGCTDGETVQQQVKSLDNAKLPQCGYTKTGYIFSEWNSSADGTGQSYMPDDEYLVPAVDKSICFYAQWVPISYYITYESNHSIAEQEVLTYIYDEDKPLLDEIFTRKGYSFSGWNTEIDGSGTSYVAKQVIRNLSDRNLSTVTMYAQWSARRYTITLDRQDGRGGSGSVQVMFDSSLPAAQKPQRTGYTFGGYYDMIDGKGVLYYDAGMTAMVVYKIADNLTLYAYWVQNENFIVFDANCTGFGGTMNDISTYSGSVELLPVCGFTRPGYNFVRWDTAANGSGTGGAAGAEFIVPASDKSIMLYAIWTPQQKNIVFEPNDCDYIEKANISTYTDGTITMPACSYTKKGFSFEGWSESSDGSGVLYAPSVSFDVYATDNSITFYAIWKLIEYDIVYDLDDGINHAENPLKYTVLSGKIVLKQPSRVGYEFAGWSNGGEIAADTIGIQYFTAYWDAIRYEISYEMDGGTNHTDNPLFYYVYSETIRLKNPTKAGATFVEWIGGSVIETGSIGNLEFTARWKGDEYDIYYELNGGTNHEDNPDSYTFESDIIVLEDASKHGYNFLRWDEGDTIPKGSEGVKIFTAVWEPIDYAITYDYKGGIEDPTHPSSYTIESELITIAAPRKNGYIFDGWVEGKYIYSGSTGDKTFTAKWSPEEYNIAYDLSGGTNHEDNPDIYTIESPEIVLEDPTRDHYIFIKWLDAEEHPCDTIEAESYGDKWFIAVWEAEEFTITYHLLGGVNGSGNPDTYTIESVDIILNDPTKEGYTFMGWEEGEGKIEKGKTGNKTFTAVWKAIDYNIIYDYSDWDADPGNQVSYTIESEDITLITPSNGTKTIIRWEVSTDGGATWATLEGGVIKKGTVGDLNIRVIWNN